MCDALLQAYFEFCCRQTINASFQDHFEDWSLSIETGREIFDLEADIAQEDKNRHKMTIETRDGQGDGQMNNCST